jgi:hypothetical protein
MKAQEFANYEAILNEVFWISGNIIAGPSFIVLEFIENDFIFILKTSLVAYKHNFILSANILRCLGNIACENNAIREKLLNYDIFSTLEDVAYRKID